MPDLIDPASLIDLRNLALAAAVGFLIGFEREWTHAVEARAHTFAGARTFALIGFVGGLAGFMSDDWRFIAVAFAAVAALTIVAYWAGARAAPEIGGTTEIAIFATFLLGLAATRGHLLVAAVGGVSVAVILSLKESVGRLAASLSAAEIRAALRFLSISIIVLPVLPNAGYGPYAALNPREIWLMVVFISGLSFLGYWLVKALGPKQGVFVTGIVGGLASSTAAALLLQQAAGRPAPDAVLEVGNPMEVRPALIFAALLAVISLASRYGADRFGDGALYIVGLASGLADVDAMTLTAGRQAATGGIGAIAAGGAIMAAVASNIIAKGAMAWTICGRGVGLPVAGAFAAILAAGAGAYLLLPAS